MGSGDAGGADQLVAEPAKRHDCSDSGCPRESFTCSFLLQKARIGAYVVRQQLARRKRYPLVLMLEPLFRCNLACAGCGKIDYPEEILNQRLSVEDCLKAVDECGAPVVSIAGGEPLLHKEINTVVEGIIARRKFVYLCTNALLLKKKLSMFRPSPYFVWSVHLDGDEEMHDRSVCETGVYDRAVLAIKAAKEQGFRVNINCTLFNDADPERVARFLGNVARRWAMDGINRGSRPSSASPHPAGLGSPPDPRGLPFRLFRRCGSSPPTPPPPDACPGAIHPRCRSRLRSFLRSPRSGCPLRRASRPCASPAHRFPCLRLRASPRPCECLPPWPPRRVSPRAPIHAAAGAPVIHLPQAAPRMRPLVPYQPAQVPSMQRLDLSAISRAVSAGVGKLRLEAIRIPSPPITKPCSPVLRPSEGPPMPKAPIRRREAPRRSADGGHQPDHARGADTEKIMEQASRHFARVMMEEGWVGHSDHDADPRTGLDPPTTASATS